MLSLSAFNALLKIIEEPPEHLMFILATTELHKVPATILSRCQRFAFRRISQEDIAARLQYVAYQDNIDLDDSAAKVLARLADGGMRDALSLLDQCASATAGELTADRVYACLGIAGTRDCGKLMAFIAQQDCAGALELLNRLYADGKDMGALLDELACMTRDMMVLKTAPKAGISMLSGVATDEQTQSLAQAFSSGELVRMMNLIQDTASGFTRSGSKRTDAELCIVNMCRPELTEDIGSIISRLTRIEDQIRSGNLVVGAPAVQAIIPAKEELTQETVQDTGDDLYQSSPEENNDVLPDEAPEGFWADVADAVRKELKPPAVGFFTTTPNSPVKGVLHGNHLTLVCTNLFTMQIINKPEVLDLVALKASAKLGTQVRVTVTDSEHSVQKTQQMEQLLSFGRAHGNIVNIKDN